MEIVIRHKNGDSARCIAKSNKVDHHRIGRIVAQQATQGDFKRKTGSGRPKILSDREERHIVRSVLGPSQPTTRDIQQSLLYEFNVKPSLSTIRRVLYRHQVHGRIRAKKPALSKQQMKVRLQWARQFSTWTAEDWSLVIFTDESAVAMDQNAQQPWVWRRKNTRYQAQNVKKTVKHGGGTVMVWACFCAHGPGYLCRLPSGLDAPLYLEILEGEFTMTGEEYYDGGNYFLLHDGCSVHTAKMVTRWLDHNCGYTLPWPAHSPDLNPIENLWSIVKREIYRQGRASSKDELFERISKAYYNLSPLVCSELVESMPRRIQAVIKAKGGNTKY